MSTATTKKTDAPPAKPAPAELIVTAREMPEIKQLGICSTCVNQSTCLFLKASRQPVWYCDEFSDCSADNAPVQPVRVIEPAPAENYGEAQGVGLCVNCETRTDCMHRSPGKPVWECEDYR